MKKMIIPVLVAATLIITGACGFAAGAPVRAADVEVYFSPGGGATDAVVRLIGSAQKEVLVQAFTLSSQSIVKALLDAHSRGVKVEIILDRSERAEGMTPAVILANAGIPVFLDGAHILARSTILIVDSQTVTTGSFSFSRAGEESNAEDLVIIRSVGLAKNYRESWLRHRSHSEKP